MQQNFGPYLLKAQQIFYTSELSCAFVNLRPVVKGHVLVIPKRVVARFKDLTPEECTDMFLTVQKVGQVLDKAYGTASLSIDVQDGPDSGQTVPHVHAHVMPRRAGDFKRNDDIYEEIEKSERIDNPTGKNRTLEEMEEEANFLKSFFSLPNQ